MLRRRRLDAHFASLYAEFEDENLGEIEQLDVNIFLSFLCLCLATS